MEMQSTDEKYMKEAIKQAKKAYAIGEVPIGCVIVYQDKIIGRGYNRRTIDNNTLAHAELAAIRKASRKMNDWRLEDCTMYVTLEPCQMCAGALYWSQISKIVYGATDVNRGFVKMGTQLHPKTSVVSGVLANEASELMKRFFVERRK